MLFIKHFHKVLCTREQEARESPRDNDLPKSPSLLGVVGKGILEETGEKMPFICTFWGRKPLGLMS